MGLNVKQVMERLHVRSLEGLNLREAMEALRRQMIRDVETTTAPASAAAAAAATPNTPASSAPASTSPRYFEEEDDDYDVTFTMDGEDALAEGFGPDEVAGMSDSASSEAAGDLEDLDALGDDDLDDVPDFGPPPSAAHTTRAARPSTPARNNPPAPTPTEEPAAEEPAASPAQRHIAQLRAIRGGGTPTTHQRAAYRNVVVSELGEPETVALVRGLWRTVPERLGPEQLDALISWGKQDTFAEEAADVLAVLRAARQQAAAAAPEETTSPPSTPPRPALRSSRASPAPRPSSGGR